MTSSRIFFLATESLEEVRARLLVSGVAEEDITPVSQDVLKAFSRFVGEPGVWVDYRELGWQIYA